MTGNNNIKEKEIGGITITDWKSAFAELVRIAIDKDYFSDILYYELYPNIEEEIKDIEDEEEQDDIYNAKYDFVYEAFEEIFNEEY